MLPVRLGGGFCLWFYIRLFADFGSPEVWGGLRITGNGNGLWFELRCLWFELAEEGGGDQGAWGEVVEDDGEGEEGVEGLALAGGEVEADDAVGGG